MSLNKNTNGSIMIAALIMALITGALVGLFLRTVSQEVEYAHRSRMAFQAMNVAEAGIETAIHAMNNGQLASPKWTSGSGGWFLDTKNGTASDLTVFSSFRGAQRNAKIFIKPGSNSAKAVAEGIISLPGGQEVTRQVYVELGTRSLWANGLLARDSITLNGNNILVDSYKSSEGEYGDYKANGDLNKNDKGSVASLSIEPDVVTSGNADIIGSVAVGGTDNPPDVGPNGSIRGINDPNGYVDWDNRVTYQFDAYLPDPSLPDIPASATVYTEITNKTLQGSYSDIPTYYKLSSDFAITNKDVGSTTDKDGNVTTQYYQVQGNVILIVDGDINIQGELKLITDASGKSSELQVYTTGDIDVSGNSASIVNPSGQPTDLILYGVGKDDPLTVVDETPMFNLAGNGAFYGAVYAPNYDVKLDGSGNSGEMFGAVVADTITFGGGYKFHYDEDLAGYDSDLAMKVTKWRELTAATERKNMNTILSDGL